MADSQTIKQAVAKARTQWLNTAVINSGAKLALLPSSLAAFVSLVLLAGGWIDLAGVILIVSLGLLLVVSILFGVRTTYSKSRSTGSPDWVLLLDRASGGNDKFPSWLEAPAEFKPAIAAQIPKPSVVNLGQSRNWSNLFLVLVLLSLPFAVMGWQSSSNESSDLSSKPLATADTGDSIEAASRGTVSVQIDSDSIQNGVPHVLPDLNVGAPRTPIDIEVVNVGSGPLRVSETSPLTLGTSTPNVFVQIHVNGAPVLIPTNSSNRYSIALSGLEVGQFSVDLEFWSDDPTAPFHILLTGKVVAPDDSSGAAGDSSQPSGGNSEEVADPEPETSDGTVEGDPPNAEPTPENPESVEESDTGTSDNAGPPPLPEPETEEPEDIDPNHVSPETRDGDTIKQERSKWIYDPDGDNKDGVKLRRASVEPKGERSLPRTALTNRERELLKKLFKRLYE